MILDTCEVIRLIKKYSSGGGGDLSNCVKLFSTDSQTLTGARITFKNASIIFSSTPPIYTGDAAITENKQLATKEYVDAHAGSGYLKLNSTTSQTVNSEVAFIKPIVTKNFTVEDNTTAKLTIFDVQAAEAGNAVTAYGLLQAKADEAIQDKDGDAITNWYVATHRYVNSHIHSYAPNKNSGGDLFNKEPEVVNMAWAAPTACNGNWNDPNAYVMQTKDAMSIGYLKVGSDGTGEFHADNVSCATCKHPRDGNFPYDIATKEYVDTHSGGGGVTKEYVDNAVSACYDASVHEGDNNIFNIVIDNHGEPPPPLKAKGAKNYTGKFLVNGDLRVHYDDINLKDMNSLPDFDSVINKYYVMQLMMPFIEEEISNEGDYAVSRCRNLFIPKQKETSTDPDPTVDIQLNGTFKVPEITESSADRCAATKKYVDDHSGGGGGSGIKQNDNIQAIKWIYAPSGSINFYQTHTFNPTQTVAGSNIYQLFNIEFKHNTDTSAINCLAAIRPSGDLVNWGLKSTVKGEVGTEFHYVENIGTYCTMPKFQWIHRRASVWDDTGDSYFYRLTENDFLPSDNANYKTIDVVELNKERRSGDNPSAYYSTQHKLEMAPVPIYTGITTNIRSNYGNLYLEDTEGPYTYLIDVDANNSTDWINEYTLGHYNIQSTRFKLFRLTYREPLLASGAEHNPPWILSAYTRLESSIAPSVITGIRPTYLWHQTTISANDQKGNTGSCTFQFPAMDKSIGGDSQRPNFKWKKYTDGAEYTKYIAFDASNDDVISQCNDELPKFKEDGTVLYKRHAIKQIGGKNMLCACLSEFKQFDDGTETLVKEWYIKPIKESNGEAEGWNYYNRPIPKRKT